MKRWFYFIVLIFSICLLISYLLFFSIGLISAIEKVCFEKACFDVDVVTSQDEKTIGLMGVTHLGEGRGMFFVYDEDGNYSFWMKNTLIPLDIIWIDKNYEVIYVRSVFPCEGETCEVYSAPKTAKYVLEINYGLTEEYEISVGDKVRID